MVNRLKILLNEAEYRALLQMAMDELRIPDDQIRYILRQELLRRGLLSPDELDQVAGGNKNASALSPNP